MDVSSLRSCTRERASIRSAHACWLVRFATIVSCSVGLPSCSGSEDPTQERQLAGGLVEARSGSTVAGFVTVKRRAGVVRVFLNVLRAPPGDHRVQLHQNGDCTAADALSAGPHWNPDSEPADGVRLGDARLGDLGTMHVDETGRGLLSFSSAAFGLGDGTEFDIVGHALVIHEKPDDPASQPGGSAGARLACGVIR
jgi:Cu-Zn family superoxide dismutase